jgi:hypothetical protein
MYRKAEGVCWINRCYPIAVYSSALFTLQGFHSISLLWVYLQAERTSISIRAYRYNIVCSLEYHLCKVFKYTFIDPDCSESLLA